MKYDEPLSHSLGMDGFIWWVGVIEDVSDDLLKVGRVKVRIFNHHTADHEQLPTSDLPWAYPLLPVTQSTTTPNYTWGDWVCGFFMDGRMAQQPMILGVFPAIAQQ